MPELVNFSTGWNEVVGSRAQQNNKSPTHRTLDTLVEYESMFLFFRGHMGLYKVYPYHWCQDLQIGMFKPNSLEGVS